MEENCQFWDKIYNSTRRPTVYRTPINTNIAANLCPKHLLAASSRAFRGSTLLTCERHTLSIKADEQERKLRTNDSFPYSVPH